MKKNIIFVLVAVALLGTTIVANAQFASPTAQPPDGNVAPPINVGNKYQTKEGAVIVKRKFNPSPVITPSDLLNYNNNWKPKTETYNAGNPTTIGNDSIYGFETNGFIGGYGFRGHDALFYDRLYLPYSIINPTTKAQFNLPVQLCASSFGFVTACPSALTGGTTTNPSTKNPPIGTIPGGTTTTIIYPKISAQVYANGVLKSGNYSSITNFDYFKFNAPGHSPSSSVPKISYSFQSADANRCEILNAGGMELQVSNASFNDLKSATIAGYFNGNRTIAIACFNDTYDTQTIHTSQISVNNGLADVGIRPASVYFATDVATETINSTTTTEANVRWRENTKPISATLEVTGGRSNPATCRTKFVPYEHATTEKGLHRNPLGILWAQEPYQWSNWNSYLLKNINEGTGNLKFYCGDFFKSGCGHADEGMRTVDIYIQCYNNIGDSSMESPSQGHIRLQWINPAYN